MVKNAKGVWYYIYWDYCVICGLTVETRERREGPKPKDDTKRFSFREDSCGIHFC